MPLGPADYSPSIHEAKGHVGGDGTAELSTKKLLD